MTNVNKIIKKLNKSQRDKIEKRFNSLLQDEKERRLKRVLDCIILIYVLFISYFVLCIK